MNFTGEFKDGEFRNGILYDKYGKIIGKYVNGKWEQVVVEKKGKGVLYTSKKNGEWGWYKSGDDKKDGKYVGEIENKVPNGQGTLTFSDRWKFIGEWKNGKIWNGTGYNKYGNIVRKIMNGKDIK